MKKYLVILILLIIVFISFSSLQSLKIIESNFKAHRIAHGGGGIKGDTYTNSIEALNYNIKKGFRYFELDFSFTKDGHLVCIHDWNHSFKRSFGFDTNEKPSLETFRFLVKNKSKYQKCTLSTLTTWMQNHPSAKIITDVKGDNLKALKIISEKVPNYKNQVIPQIYTPNNYSQVKDIGYKQIIWTLYRYGGNNNEVLKIVEEFNGPFAITMPKGRATSNLPNKLAKKNIPTYVHTINDVEEKNKFINELNIIEIYTDFLSPK